MTLVSVVMPALDQVEFVDRAVESVLSQDHGDLELVAVDGGSTDGTLERLRAWERDDPRVRLLPGPDRGQGHALARGFAASRGGLLGWLNSDDRYLPGAVAAGVRHLEARPGIDVVYGRGWYVDRDDRPLWPYPTAPFDRDRLRRHCFVCQPAVFFRRRLVEIAPVREDLRCALDYELWIRASARLAFEHVDELWAASRLHDASKTVVERRLVYEEAQAVCREHFGYHPFAWILGEVYELGLGARPVPRKRIAPLLVAYPWAILRFLVRNRTLRRPGELLRELAGHAAGLPAFLARALRPTGRSGPAPPAGSRL